MNYTLTQLARISPRHHRRHIWQARLSRVWKAYLRVASGLAGVIGKLFMTLQGTFILMPPFAWLAKRAARQERPGWNSLGKPRERRHRGEGSCSVMNNVPITPANPLATRRYGFHTRLRRRLPDGAAMCSGPIPRQLRERVGHYGTFGRGGISSKAAGWRVVPQHIAIDRETTRCGFLGKVQERKHRIIGVSVDVEVVDAVPTWREPVGLKGRPYDKRRAVSSDAARWRNVARGRNSSWRGRDTDDATANHTSRPRARRSSRPPSVSVSPNLMSL